MKKLILILMLSVHLLDAANVSGYVADQESGETIIGVNVMVTGTDLGAATDRNGFFTIAGIPTGG